VWPTNGSSQFILGYQIDREIYFASNQVLNSSVAKASYTSLSISGAVPKNAKTFSGTLGVTGGSASSFVFVSPDSNGTGGQAFESSGGTATAQQIFSDLPIITPQITYYQSGTAGTSSYNISVTNYSI
jgi:hypothetical protein